MRGHEPKPSSGGARARAGFVLQLGIGWQSRDWLLRAKALERMDGVRCGSPHAPWGDEPISGRPSLRRLPTLEPRCPRGRPANRGQAAAGALNGLAGTCHRVASALA